MYKKLLLLLLVFLMPANVLAVTAGTKTETVVFNKCVDGDTARFMRGTTEIKVRFLAIDTPETVHPTKEVEAFGKEASNYTCDRLKSAKKIVLEYDPKSAEKDKYDRYLAWIFLDDVLLQDDIIKNGYAKVAYLYSDYLYTDLLKASEKEARAEKVGQWGLPDVKEKDQEPEKPVEENVVKENQGIFDLVYNFISEFFDKLIEFVDNIIEDML
jgi:Micrococcal nuclease (thermonuclease) homologs